MAFVHGASAGTRDSWAYRRLSHRLAASGVAVLLYDRRGEGASHAGAADDGFRHLAGDVLAAVRLLRAHPRIDPRRVGLSGGSQGGWVSALAATMSPDVVFLVLRVTPARMPSQAELDHAEWAMRADHRSHGDIQAALAHLRRYFAYVATGEGWELLAASSARAAQAEWGRYVDQPERPEQLDWWRGHHDFDVYGVLTRLQVPVLAVYGASDMVAPPALNAGLMRQALEEAGVEHVVEIIPDAGHALELPGMFLDEDMGTWVWPSYSARARELIVGWIQGQRSAGE